RRPPSSCWTAATRAPASCCATPTRRATSPSCSTPPSPCPATAAGRPTPTHSGVPPDPPPYPISEGEQGEPLLPRLHQLGLRERIELLVQLCEALRSAHQQGWLLAELDPAMVWLGPKGDVRLMGLGLARIPDPTDPFDRGLSLGASAAFVAP